MCCILPVMHLCAFLCISVHLGGKIPDLRTIWMSAGARSTRFMMRKNAHECTLMHTNASECARIHQGPHILTQEEPSGLKAKLTWTGMGWTGCGRAILPWGVPMEHPCATTCHPSLHTNWYTSVHTRVNASAYTSECVCEWMHLNALECVRMRVRQNATCWQNAPYVGRHTNAFECNSCRMQRTANAQ